MVASATAEALKSWGSFGLVLMLLGLVCWHLNRRLKAAEERETELRTELAALNKARLEDAQKMTAVTQAGTATMESRSKGDREMASIVAFMADEMAALRQEIRQPGRARRQGSR